MVDENKDVVNEEVAEEVVEEVTEEVTEDAAKEVTEDWEAFVRSEVSGALDTFLPFSVSGDMGVSYKRPVLEVTESGTRYDKKKADGVTIVIDLKFAESVDSPE